MSTELPISGKLKINLYDGIRGNLIKRNADLEDYINHPHTVEEKLNQTAYRIKSKFVVVDVDPKNKEIGFTSEEWEMISETLKHQSVILAYWSHSGKSIHAVLLADWNTPDEYRLAQNAAAMAIKQYDKNALGFNRPWILSRRKDYVISNPNAVPLQYEKVVEKIKQVKKKAQTESRPRKDIYSDQVFYSSELKVTGEVTYYNGEGAEYDSIFISPKRVIQKGNRKETIKGLIAKWIPIQHNREALGFNTMRIFTERINSQNCNPQLTRKEVFDIVDEMMNRYLTGELSVALERTVKINVQVEKPIRKSARQSAAHLVKNIDEVTEIVNWVKNTDSTKSAAKKAFPGKASWIQRNWEGIQYTISMNVLKAVITNEETALSMQTLKNTEIRVKKTSKGLPKDF